VILNVSYFSFNFKYFFSNNNNIFDRPSADEVGLNNQKRTNGEFVRNNMKPGKVEREGKQ